MSRETRGVRRWIGVGVAVVAVVEEIRYYAGASWLPPEARAKANRANELIDSIEPYYAGD